MNKNKQNKSTFCGKDGQAKLMIVTCFDTINDDLK